MYIDISSSRSGETERRGSSLGLYDRMVPDQSTLYYTLQSIPNPLINEAISVTTLAGITSSASGGMSIALAAMADTLYCPCSRRRHSSGGMDTLPHHGAVITLRAVTGLTHRQSCKAIFAITVLKTTVVFVVIAVYYLTGIV